MLPTPAGRRGGDADSDAQEKPQELSTQAFLSPLEKGPRESNEGVLAGGGGQFPVGKYRARHCWRGARPHRGFTFTMGFYSFFFSTSRGEKGEAHFIKTVMF